LGGSNEKVVDCRSIAVVRGWFFDKQGIRGPPFNNLEGVAA
jgi:hypothetical protein